MDAHVPKEASDPGLLSAISKLLGAVAASQTVQASLDHTMAFLTRWSPQQALVLAAPPSSPSSDAAATWKLLAAWPVAPPAQSPADAAGPELESILATRAASGASSCPLLLTEPAALATLLAALRGQAGEAPAQTAVVLPLSDETRGGVAGAVVILWAQPHAFSADEQECYRILCACLSGHLGRLLGKERLDTALGDFVLMHQLGQKLDACGSFEDVLRLFLQPAPARDEAEILLYTLDNNDQGQPTWLTAIHHIHPDAEPRMGRVGVRYHLPDIPFSKLYLKSPDEPICISDVTTDPRLDEQARSLYLQIGVRATILVGLTVNGRWLGLVNLMWPRPVELHERERRIYQALAKHAAMRLEHTRAIERLNASLDVINHQRTLLSTILDSAPVGVVVTESATGRTILSNPAAVQLLGRSIDLESGSAKPIDSVQFLRPESGTPCPAEALPGARALETGVTQRGEYDIVWPDSSLHSLEVTGVPLRDAAGAITRLVLVLTDITERKHAEAERRTLQERTLQAQAAALAERSAPLIPITDDILVMPIVGTIDSERGRQLLDTILTGAVQSHTRVAIIDITGVRAVDTHSAGILNRVARALRLLGVLPILTGIKADMAQTIVGLGIDLTGTVTQSTLQAGIQHALQHLGRAGIK